LIRRVHYTKPSFMALYVRCPPEAAVNDLALSPGRGRVPGDLGSMRVVVEVLLDNATAVPTQVVNKGFCA
jgi:hypothetical protein